MIQRIQTLYLLIIAALMAVTLFSGLAWFAGDAGEFGLYAFGLKTAEGELVQSTVYMGVLLALACAVVVHLFCFVLHSAAHGLPKLLPNPWVRAFLGGCVVVVFTLLYGSMRYNGAGMNIIAAAVEQGQALPWDWIVKILLTALTLSSGFKGGEVVPSFFVGATFGCVAAPLLGIPAGFGAALGLAGVFCGASNCVVASLVLAIELFGAQGLWYFAIVCGITYALSGYAGLYHSQLFLTDKLEPEYRIIRGHNHH